VESNIEILEAAGDKLRMKYKDKQIPDVELVKFKVGQSFISTGCCFTNTTASIYG
jgi:hypothetical protein